MSEKVSFDVGVHHNGIPKKIPASAGSIVSPPPVMKRIETLLAELDSKELKPTWNSLLEIGSEPDTFKTIKERYTQELSSKEQALVKRWENLQKTLGASEKPDKNFTKLFLEKFKLEKNPAVSKYATMSRLSNDSTIIRALRMFVTKKPA